MPQRNYLPGHKIKLVHSGNEYFEELVKVIDAASKVLHLQVYIFDNDSTGAMVLSALKNANSRGVKVYVMVDGFGSYSLKKTFTEMMRSEGIFFRFFSPLPFSGVTQVARRLHQKICVADGKIAIVGGINIADKYHGDNFHKPWLDYALLVQGEVCNELELYCSNVWRRKYSVKRKKNIVKPISEEPVLVRMSRNDWLRGKNEISAAYKFMLSNAKDEIIIVASYFIPSKRLLNILNYAGSRGKQIHIVLAQNSDVPFIKGAISYLYDNLLRHNIRIYEYNDAILHAKVCVIDESWVSIGSHNLNHLSEFMSLEMNLDVLDSSFASAFASELKSLIREHCTEINWSEYQHSKSVFRQAFNWVSYNLISASQRVLYMLNRPEKVVRKSIRIKAVAK